VGYETAVEELAIVNPGCEDGTTNWTAFRADLTISSTAHSGAAACQICCLVDTGCTLDDFPDAIDGPLQGARYAAEASVRRAPGTTSEILATITVREWDAINVQGNQVPGPFVTLSDDEWSRVSTTLTVVGATDQALDMYVFQAGNTGDCILVDDLRLRQLFF